LNWESLKESPLFIGGHRKCGTTLFVSLLDAHEELFSFPSETGFFYKFYPLFDGEGHSPEEKEERVIEAILKTLDEVLEKWVGYENCPGYSFEKLTELFRERLPKNGRKSKDYLDASVYAAWKLLSGGKAYPKAKTQHAQKYWVEKTTSTEIYANTLFDWYPKAKFIHILRDPRDNFGAIKAGWEKRYQYQFDSKERLLQSVIDRSRLGMEMAGINQSRFGADRYQIIRYEDFVTRPEETLRTVCDFLGIRFQPVLLTPTFCGEPWGGNNHELKKFTAISSDHVDRWRERITEHEAKVLEYYFGDLMPKYQYPLAFDRQAAADAAREHYKWFNFAQVYSLKVEQVYKL